MTWRTISATRPSAPARISRRVGQVLEDDALLLGLLDLQAVGGHLVLGAAVDVVHLLGAQAHGGAAGVHGGVAAAYDGHPLAQGDGLVAHHMAEEVDAADDAGQILAGAAGAGGHPGADAHQDGVIVLA